jgi:hypothetical protein
MQMPAIFIGDARHMDDTPAAPVPAYVTPEFVEERRRIQPIGLCLTPTRRPFDRTGINDKIGHPHRRERAVQPETIPARLKAAHRRRVDGKSEALLRGRDLSRERWQIARRCRAQSRRLRRAAGTKAQLPRRVAKVEGEQ